MPDRRTFMAASLTGFAAAALVPNELGATPAEASAKAGPKESLAFDPRAKLRAISSRAKQLWPVIYVDPTNLVSNLERDIEAAFEGGADAAVIELGKDIPTLTKAVEHARAKYPTAKLGVNYLGDDADDKYGYITSFKLAKEFSCEITWTDFCGVDLIKELPEISLHAIEAARPANTFYVSGIHMKYGTLLDPTKTIEQSAFQAMGWVEGIVITGPKTGVPTDPDRARRTRQVVGSYPMGAASGVTAENFPLIAEWVDYCLVNTSIADADHRILVDKVRRLRQVMGS